MKLMHPLLVYSVICPACRLCRTCATFRLGSPLQLRLVSRFRMVHVDVVGAQIRMVTCTLLGFYPIIRRAAVLDY